MTLDLSQIYIADDHEIVAKGISALVSKVLETEAVQVVKNGEELIRKVLSKRPSLVILDVEMPVKDGLETLKDLRSRGYTFPVLMLSMVEEQAIIQSAMDLGANGYLHKDCSEEELKEAFEAASRNEFYLSKEAKNAMVGVKSPKQLVGSSQTYNITKRELEVLELICEGLTSKEIGNKLFISARTVESHKENLMQKLDVNSSSKLVAKALKNQLV